MLSFIKETAVHFYISIDKVNYKFLLIGLNKLALPLILQWSIFKQQDVLADIIQGDSHALKWYFVIWS